MRYNVRRIIPIVISSLTIVVALVLQFAVFCVKDRFSWSEFAPQLVINLFLLITTAVLWINSGTDRAKREEKSAYKDNAAVYATKIKEITDESKLCDLRTFCRIKSDTMRDDKITAQLASVGIDRKMYDSSLRTVTKQQLQSDGYTNRQIRAIEYVRSGRVRVKPIHYIDLMSDSKSADDCGVNYDERADKAVRIVSRALRAVFTAVVLAMLSIEPAQDIANISAWVMFFLRLFTIVWTGYSSEHEGYARITETKNKVILRRIAFLHEFTEWASLPRLNGSEIRDNAKSLMS